MPDQHPARRGFSILVGAVFFAAFAQAQPSAAPPPPNSIEQSLINRVTPGALRANVAFLASDLLEGRGTPSRGLDVAAEYIAAQFAVDGLHPLPGGTYFQISGWHVLSADPKHLSLSAEWNGKSWEASATNLTVSNPSEISTGLQDAVFLDLKAENPTAGIENGAIAGKVVLVVAGSGASNSGLYRYLRWMRGRPAAELPSATVILTESDPPEYFRRSRPVADDTTGDAPPLLVMWKSPDLARELSAAAPAAPVKIRLDVGTPLRTNYTLKNVIGTLPGSDPTLSQTYILVSGHYDHLGIVGEGEGDHLYNGANDDASGTAEVLELARIFSKLPVRPKRSIVFVAWFGEELGMLGSQWYARHPVYPLAQTVANLNFEQVGRADTETDKRHLSMTGFGFSDIGKALEDAAAVTGVSAEPDSASNAFFDRSDNAALARAGVPAHSLTVMYEYSDYHGAADNWDKLDYTNMAAITRTSALLLYRLAENATAPQWNANDSAAARYREAWNKLHRQPAGEASTH